MKHNFLKMTTTFASFAILAGCSLQPQQISREELKLPNSEALDELVNISIEARDELRLLAKSQETIAQKNMTKEQHEQRFLQATKVPSGFEKKGDFVFAGRAIDAARALAAATDYRFMTDGKENADEPWVYVNIKNEPLNEALKELGIQTGEKVRIEVHSKILRFVYLN